MKYSDETINAFLEGELDESARAEFLVALSDDPDLKARVTIFREMDGLLTEGDWELTDGKENSESSRRFQDFMKSEEGSSYFDLIQNADKQFHAEPATGRQIFDRFGKLAIAASVLLLAIAAVFFLNKEVSTGALYVAYKDSGSLPSLVNRGGERDFISYDSLLQGRNDDAALKWLNGYMVENSGNLNPQLYMHKGMLLLDLDKTEEAILTFNKLLNSNTVDATKANWYLALSFLKAGDKESALRQLKLLQDSGSNFNKTAVSELIKELE